ncbi:MAG: PA14 domain-containing protein [Bacteroidota bacterium]
MNQTFINFKKSYYGGILLSIAWVFAVIVLLINRTQALAQAPACAGNKGLTAEYYAGFFADDQSFFINHTPGLTRIDTSLDYRSANSWGDILPPAVGTLANPDLFSVRFRGSIYLATAGDYTFYLGSDDASYFWLDNAALASPASSGEALISVPGIHAYQIKYVTLPLSAGWHNLLIHHGEKLSGDLFSFEYQATSLGIPRQIVPATILCTGAAKGIRYNPNTFSLTQGASSSSSVPTLVAGSSPLTNIAIANAASLPAGITMNAATGVVTVDNTVPLGHYLIDVTLTNASGFVTFTQVLMVSVLVTPPASCAGLDPRGSPATSGLYAEYYAGNFADDQSFFINHTPQLIRTDANLNYNTDNSWGAILPPATGSTANPQQYSARFRGSMYIATAGYYTFYLGSDDGSYLWLDNAAIASPAVAADALINNGGAHAYAYKQASVYLTAGLHNLLIHYGQGGSQNRLTLEYASNDLGIARQIVPGSLLCTGSEKGILFNPNQLKITSGTAVSSAPPILNAGSSALTGIAIANAASLPAGITINSTTGVVIVANTVPLGSHVLNVTLTNASGSLTFDGALTVSVLAAPPPDCVGYDPGGNAASSGLYAEYYANYFADDQSFFSNTKPRLTRTDGVINFNTDTWGAISPPATGGAYSPNKYSARFRGTIYIATAGNYTFHLGSDDAGYLWLDNAALLASPLTSDALINNGGGHGYIIKSGAVYLAIGRHPILIHYGEATGGNSLTLEYESADAGVSRQIVPNRALCTAELVSITYTPRRQQIPLGTAASSATPVIVAGSAPIMDISIGNAASLPAGITVNQTTGVVTADNTVPSGNYNLNITLTSANGSVTFLTAFTAVVLAPAPLNCSATDPGGESSTSGVYAEYYTGYFDDDHSFFVNQTPGLLRTEYNLNYSTNTWGAILPPASGSIADANNYSARYRGSVSVPTTGTYTFHLGSDDASYLWLDASTVDVPAVTAEALINNGGRHAYVVKSNSVVLTAGLHDILVHYGENASGNLLTLEYEATALGLARQIIPNNALCTGVSFEPLPIQLLYFQAKAQATGIALSWATQSETNHSHYTVERSTDARSFEAVLRVESKNGNVQSRQNYQAFDASPQRGINYYRLRTTDLDGSTSVSKTVSAMYHVNQQIISIQPNPSSQQDVVLTLEGDFGSGEREIRLHNIQGKQMYQSQFEGQQTVIPTSKLSPGMYLITIKVQGQVVVEKLVVY